MMRFKITPELLEKVTLHIKNHNDNELSALLQEMHHADIAEILDEISFNESVYVIKLLDSETTSEVLMDVEDDTREKILKNLTAKEIAEEIEELDTDDAADIISELPKNRKEEVILEIEDADHAKEIVELLRYNENSAGGLMAKELVQVNEHWTVLKCVKEMRIQAKKVTRVHSIYVVDDNNKLKGRLSLKDLLVSSANSLISDIYIQKVDFVKVNDKAKDVANIMRKYDLEAIPVVNELGILVGRITIDDIVDVIKEEADKDYQLAAGLTDDIEADATFLELIKARLPWLILGLVGGIVAASIMGGLGGFPEKYKMLFYFTSLISAAAGNVGVQSSAIIVQGLANDNLKDSTKSRLIKELLIASLNGISLATIIFGFSFFWGHNLKISLSISLSLVIAITNAGIIGTFIPLFLHKRNINPAIATGPFITTSNDILGVFVYFMTAKFILGF